MKADQPCYLTISQAAELIRERQLSPVELVQSVLKRIDEVEPRINAYITLLREEALEAAKAAESSILAGNYAGPLHGIPIGLKDVFSTKGVLTTAGSKVLAGWVPTENATIVERLKTAGAIIMGKHNMHEFALGPTNIRSYYGLVRNPWDLERIPGGSSGGSAAAIAASECLGAVGTDAAGSIREPASLCGIVGLKTTYGRVSLHGMVAPAWSMDTVGPMAKTVRDAALMLNVLAGRDPEDFISAEVPVPDYIQELQLGIKGLKIGVPRDYFFKGADEAVLKAVEGAIDLFRELGASVQEVDLPGIELATTARMVIRGAEATAYHLPHLRAHPGDYGPHLLSFLEVGMLYTAVQYVQAQRLRTRLVKEADKLLRQVDILVTPTTPVTAFKIEDVVASKSSEAEMASRLMPLTAPINLLGLPAISMPCGFTPGGLPIGLQLVGKPFAEVTILRTAYAYESHTEWHRWRPPM